RPPGRPTATVVPPRSWSTKATGTMATSPSTNSTRWNCRVARNTSAGNRPYAAAGGRKPARSGGKESNMAQTAGQAANAEALLSVNNIEVVYDEVILVLRGVSLDVPQGQIVTLLGANGAGKSTTLK